MFGSALDKSEIPIWFSQSDGTNPLVQIVFPTTGVKWNTTATTENRVTANKLEYYSTAGVYVANKQQLWFLKCQRLYM